jgi:hypothetical protein
MPTSFIMLDSGLNILIDATSDIMELVWVSCEEDWITREQAITRVKPTE